MGKYVDGYVLPVPKKNLRAYRRLALKMAKIFREHGALEVWECAGEDLKPAFGVPFPRKIKLKPGETLVFSWITYKSRADRDRVNARVMSDARCSDVDMKTMPFDHTRMLYGGFAVMVQA